MKKKNIFPMLLALAAVVLAGCSKNEAFTEPGEEGSASMTVRLADTPLAGGSDARSTEDLSDVDSKIFSYRVYVFGWNSGILEAEAAGDPGKTTTLRDLRTSSTKRVVVLANLDVYPQVTSYDELSATPYLYDLDRQAPEVIEEKGFLMSGISARPVTLTEAGPNVEYIDLQRAVAKVSLETLRFVPAEGHDIGKLTILGVSAQRVAPEVTLAPIESYYTMQNPRHYGGVANDDTDLVVKDYLRDDLDMGAAPYTVDQPYTLGNYFLVFPNTNAENCTLLTVIADYDGQRLYYPVKINYTDGNVSTDGKFVEPNRHYQVNLTLKKFGDGSVDPEVPGENADLEVTVEVEDWKVIVQNEEW